MINIRNAFICFVLTVALSGSCVSADLANTHSEIKASDLLGLVGLPFIGLEKHSFRINGKNSKGETVGTASFKNPDPTIGKAENIAWYWNPENGFKIITTQSELLHAYEKNWKIPFQFSKLCINESGVVAGDFLIDQVKNERGHFNQCPWFWWSVEQGIHLSALPDSYQLFTDIDNSGRVLLSRQDGYAITDISSMDDLKVFDFPINEFNVMIKNWLINYCCNQQIENLNKLLSVRDSQFLTIEYYNNAKPNQPAIHVQSWTEDGGVQGMGGGHGILRYSNIGHTFGMWPKGGILITFTFTIDSQGLNMAIRRM